MRTESLEDSYLALPDGAGPHPGVVVIHEASGLNDHIRDVCRRFAEHGYAALGVDLFGRRNRVVCMARMFLGGMAGNLDYFGVPALKAALGRLANHPEVDAGRIGAIGFCLGGSIVLTWGCTDKRLKAIAPYYGAAPKPRKAIRRLCRWLGRGRTRISRPRLPPSWRPSSPRPAFLTTSRSIQERSMPSSTTRCGPTTPAPRPTRGNVCSPSSRSTWSAPLQSRAEP